MDGVKTAVEAASLIDQMGVPAILGLFCIWLGYMYRTQLKKNDAMQDRYLTDSKENTQQMLEVMRGVEAAVKGFETTLEAIRPFLMGPRG